MLDADDLEAQAAAVDGNDVVLTKDQIAAIAASLRYGERAARALASIGTTVQLAVAG